MDSDRTIVPGVRSDTYEGEFEQGKSRLRQVIVDANGDHITKDNPLPIARRYYPSAYSWHLSRDTGITDVLASAASKGDMSITVGNGAQWAQGNKIAIYDGDNTEIDHVTVVDPPAGNVLYIDRPLDADHASALAIKGIDVNLARDGSVTPLEYYYQPRAGKKAHIHGMNVVIESTSEPSMDKFGGIAKLKYGLQFVLRNQTGRDFTPGRPFRSLTAFELSGFAYHKEPKVLTDWFVHLHLDISAMFNGMLELDGDQQQRFSVFLRDNNTGNVSTEITLNIHEEP